MQYCIDETWPRVNQPEKILPDLKPHQLANIHAMLARERGQLPVDSTDDLLEETGYLLTDHGILADKVGAGKTLTILGLAASGPPSRSYMLKKVPEGILRIRYRPNPIKATLVVVPHGLFEQWLEFVRDDTELDCISLTNTRDFWQFYDLPEEEPKTIKAFRELAPSVNRQFVQERLEHADLVLVNAKRQLEWNAVFGQYHWPRVVYEEIHQMRVPRPLLVSANFRWCISADPMDCGQLCYNAVAALQIGGYTSNPESMYVRSLDSFVDSSMTTVDCDVLYILAKAAVILDALEGFIPEEVVHMINAGNVEEAMHMAAPVADSHENILAAMVRGIDDQIKEAEASLRLYYEKGYSIEANDRKTLETTILISGLRTRQESIRERIQSATHEACMICADDMIMPTVMTCCQTVYCFRCVQECVNRHQRCPMCRADATQESYQVMIEQGEPETPVSITPDFGQLKKDEILYHLLCHIRATDPDPRILVFSDYTETLDRVAGHSARAYMSCSPLRGNPKTIASTLRKFKSGAVHVLTLNSKAMGSGLNLQMANYVIMMHRMTPELENQVIGRAQRFGRARRLVVLYVLLPNEELPTRYEQLMQLTPDLLDIVSCKQN